MSEAQIPAVLSHATMTPKEIVHALDQHIIGQKEAKRAVAIALRNRWRRLQLTDEMKREVMPKNILMIGPTGVGKTEIARRLATLANAPFIKVEATKFTEVGYVGRDVDSIIRDLIDVAIKQVREEEKKRVMAKAEILAEERVLDILVPPPRGGFKDEPKETTLFSATGSEDNLEEKLDSFSTPNQQPTTTDEGEAKKEKESVTRQLYRKKLREGQLDNKEIEVDVSAQGAGMEIMGPPGMEEMVGQLQSMLSTMSRNRTKKVRMKIKDALKQLRDDEAAHLVNEDEVKSKALELVEENGIVFIDEIDKIVRRSESGGSSGGDVSREGVQRDLLPLVEGSTIFTKYGMIKTDHILFIASGAFHLAKPSDLIPELQGRLPIRVELNALTVEDLERILTEPHASLIKQYTALLETEGVTLNFEQDAIKRLADVAYQVNDRTENIGARRLHTILERLLEIISFEAPDRSGEVINITKAYVDERLTSLLKDEDLSHFIL